MHGQAISCAHPQTCSSLYRNIGQRSNAENLTQAIPLPPDHGGEMPAIGAMRLPRLAMVMAGGTLPSLGAFGVGGHGERVVAIWLVFV